MKKTYKQEKKFLLRFLKERGVFSIYQQRIKDEKIKNVIREEHPDWTFDMYAKSKGIRQMITCLFVWSRTKEGHSFWEKIHASFLKEYDKWIKEI
jgi:hypothetical protein